MRYSSRQQHCLQSMGMVPWVSRFPGETPARGVTAVEADATDVAEALVAIEPAEEAASVILTPETSSPISVLSQQTGAETRLSPGGLSVAPPQAADGLGEWLQAQTLLPIDYRGGVHPVLGVANAPLLVVLALDNPSSLVGSMSGDDGRLFMLMLQSISLTNRDTRRCLLERPVAESVTSGGAGDDAVCQAGVNALCTTSTRAVLMLVDPWTFEDTDIAIEHHRGRLSGSGLPVWRIAHPTVLLEKPQLKRQAWQVLKAIRASLDGTAL